AAFGGGRLGVRLRAVRHAGERQAQLPLELVDVAAPVVQLPLELRDVGLALALPAPLLLHVGLYDASAGPDARSVGPEDGPHVRRHALRLERDVGRAQLGVRVRVDDRRALAHDLAQTQRTPWQPPSQLLDRGPAPSRL